MPESSPVEPAALRSAMARYATGVCIATTLTEDGDPAGLTITSFNSLSLDPPLVLWSLGLNSSNLDSFRSNDRFGISILPYEMHELARSFARSGGDKFAGVAVDTGQSGVPLIAGALVQMICVTEAQYPAGDHILFLGRVTSLAVGDGAPLVFYNSAFDALTGSGH